MKILPHFKEEDALKCSQSIGLAQNMKVLSKEDARIISDYMESCAVINEWLSNIRDPITNLLTIPSRTWSDGVYVWDSSHIHFVRNYRARLPNDFLDHVRGRLKQQFDVKTLDKDALRANFESILDSVVKGDESYYAAY